VLGDSSSSSGDNFGVLSSVEDWASLALVWRLGDSSTTPCLGVSVLTPVGNLVTSNILDVDSWVSASHGDLSSSSSGDDSSSSCGSCSSCGTSNGTSDGSLSSSDSEPSSSESHVRSSGDLESSSVVLDSLGVPAPGSSSSSDVSASPHSVGSH